MSDYEPSDTEYKETRDRLIWSEIKEVRKRYAKRAKYLGTIQGEILWEMWAMIRISWEDEVYWQRWSALEQDDPLYNALHGGHLPPPPEPKASSLREWVSIMCDGMEKFLLEKAKKYEAKESAENEENDDK